MVKKTGDPGDLDMQRAMRLAQSDTARELYDLLQASDAGQLQSAMDQASAGNMDQAKQLLRQFMTDPRAQALLQRLRSDANE